jgi:hypothetical protein
MSLDAQRASGDNGGVYLPVGTHGEQTAVDLYEPVEANGFHGAIALHGPASRAQNSAVNDAPGNFELEMPHKGSCVVSSMNGQGTQPAAGGMPQRRSSSSLQMLSSPTGSGLLTHKRYISDRTLQELTHSNGPSRATQRCSSQAGSTLTETDL